MPEQEDTQTKPQSQLLYSIDDVPPWYTAAFLGLQVFPNLKVIF